MLHEMIPAFREVWMCCGYKIMPLGEGTSMRSRLCFKQAEVPKASGSSLLFRYLLYIAVGSSGVLVDLLVFWGLTSCFDWSLTASKYASAGCALLTNFALHRVVTFRSPVDSGGLGAVWGRFSRYFVVSCVGIFVAGQLVEGLTVAVGLHPVLANLVSIAVVSVFTFFGNLLWSWRSSVD